MTRPNCSALLFGFFLSAVFSAATPQNVQGHDESREPQGAKVAVGTTAANSESTAGLAKNVILFLGDAGGLPTLNAAGLYGHDRPQRLFIQQMPHLALSDTSALDSWVTDSAAGMTALVTGRKTNNGMLSVLPNDDAHPLKTILEYAEERGLSTGVMTNMPVWDATPAACYAHVASRTRMVEIFRQVFTPRFGDGVDVLVGADRKRLFDALQQSGLDARSALEDAGYRFFETPAEITAGANRAVSIYDGPDYSPQPVVDTVLRMLSRNPKGYFLMVEWDMHTANWKKGLERVLVMDELIRHVAGTVTADTLIVFAADHSFDLRLISGRRGSPLRDQLEPAVPGKKPVLAVQDGHTGEEIVVTAQGPGADRLHGFIPNTQVFDVMMRAYGWTEAP